MLGVLAGPRSPSSSDGDHAQRSSSNGQRGFQNAVRMAAPPTVPQTLRAQQLWMYTRSMPIARLCGGSDGCAGTACEPDAVDLDQLRAELGPEAWRGAERNVRTTRRTARPRASTSLRHARADATPPPTVRTRSYRWARYPRRTLQRRPAPPTRSAGHLGAGHRRRRGRARGGHGHRGGIH